MKAVFRPTLVFLAPLLTTFTLIGLHQHADASGIDVYLSAPASHSTIFTDTITETFSGFSTGIYTSNMMGAVGTYQLSSTTKLAVVANNQYGTNTGNYVALGAQSGSSAPVTLQLPGQTAYFGFSWNAGDANNEISFYNGTTRVGYYSTATITAILKNSTVTALNGQIYMSSKYYGQPTTGLNSSEPYAFINFISTGGTFDKVVFGNKSTTGTGFESDNHTIRTTAPGADGSFVFVGTATPEPGSVALLTGFGLAGGVFLKRRKRRRR